jgi:ElaA protein
MEIKFVCLAFNELDIYQLYELLKLRQEVFIVEQQCYYLDNDGKDFQSFHLMGVDKEGKIIAYARLLPSDISYPDYASFGRIVTAPKVRGKLLGKKLMEEVMSRCETLFASKPIKISAQSYLIRFYESYGFLKVGEEYLEDDIPHHAMVFYP